MLSRILRGRVCVRRSLFPLASGSVLLPIVRIAFTEQHLLSRHRFPAETISARSHIDLTRRRERLSLASSCRSNMRSGSPRRAQ